MKLVVVESPYAGDVEENVKYAEYCLHDSLLRGEAPFASHLLYTRVLDDATPAERTHGICCGFAWGAVADVRAFYTERGWSSGMGAGLEQAFQLGQTVELRSIGEAPLVLTRQGVMQLIEEQPWKR